MDNFIRTTNNESGILTSVLNAGETGSVSLSPVPNKAPGLITLRIGTSQEEEVYFTSKNDQLGTISGLTRDVSGLNGGVGRQHPSGSTWETAQSATYINRMVGGITNQHNQAGIHRTEVLPGITFGVDSGSTDSYAIALNPAPSGYVAGMPISFRANTANTDEATLNVNGLGPKSIRLRGANLTTGEIAAGQIVTVVYDGMNFQLVSRAPIFADGWMPAGETWTFASANTFTVAGDVGAKYPKGTKIRLTQTNNRFFYVIGTSFSSPNTTVTITGGNEFSLANATITNPAYSYVETPTGFPSSFTWTPTCSGGGAMTLTGVSVLHARFSIHQEKVFYTVSFSGTTGGTAHSDLLFTTPTNRFLNTAFLIVGTGVGFDGANFVVTIQFSGSSLNTIRVQKTGNWNLGFVSVNAQGYYEV